MVKPFVMLPGVVVLPDEGALYMMNPEGGIDAVKIASGELLWTTKAAAEPLAASSGQLLAQGAPNRSRSLPLVFIDIDNGNQRAVVGLPMPPGIMPEVSNPLRTTSSVRAEVIEDDAIISWRFVQSNPSGVFPPTKPARKAEGAFSVDFRTLTTTPITLLQAEAMISATRPATVAVESLQGSEGLFVAPQRADEFFVGVQIPQSTSGLSAVLKRWNAASGKALPDVSLGENYAGSAVSSDGTHFLAVTMGRRAVHTEPGYTWSIYVLASGQKMAEQPLTAWAPPFFLWRSVFIYESAPFAHRGKNGWVQEPLALRALDLTSCREVWSRELRDAAYRGPRPPHP
jgi:hypothetical protein